MLKSFMVLFTFLLASLPINAGQYEDALKQNEKVFVYLYSPKCMYCQRFEPIYKNISNMYSTKCKFLKVNSDSKDGQHLMKLFGARYVPFVVIANSKLGEISQIEPNCLLNFKCTNYFVDKFVRK